MNSDTLIECRQVTRRFRLGEVTVHALRGLDLAVAPGEFIVLLGPSGSGKTTTLNLIGGLDRPTSGTIIVAGEDISGYDESQLTLFRRRQVGFIFQFFNLIPTLTAAENVAFALALDRRNGRRLDEAAVALLALVGLAGRADHFPSQLSGGEQQRVAIARALANQPAILLCDEPTGNLDVDMGRQVLGVINDLNRRQGTTVVLVSHNTALAPLADRIVRLRDGRVDRVELNPEPAEVGSLAW